MIFFHPRLGWQPLRQGNESWERTACFSAALLLFGWGTRTLFSFPFSFCIIHSVLQSAQGTGKPHNVTQWIIWTAALLRMWQREPGNGFVCTTVIHKHDCQCLTSSCWVFHATSYACHVTLGWTPRAVKEQGRVPLCSWLMLWTSMNWLLPCGTPRVITINFFFKNP